MYRVTLCACALLLSAGYCATTLNQALSRLSIPAAKHGEIVALNCDRDCRQRNADRRRLNRLIEKGTK